MNFIKKSNFNLFFLFLFIFYLNILNCKKKKIVKRKSKSLNARNYFKNKKNIGKKNINKKALYLKSLHRLHSNNNQTKESEKKELKNQKVQEESQLTEELNLKRRCVNYYNKQYDRPEDENLIIYGLKKLVEELLKKQKENQYTKNIRGV